MTCSKCMKQMINKWLRKQYGELMLKKIHKKRPDSKIVFLKSDNFIFHYERQFVWISGNWHSSDVKTNSGKFMVLKIWSLSWLLIFFRVVKVKRSKILFQFTSKYWFLLFQFYFYWCQALHTNSDLFPNFLG